MTRRPQDFKGTPQGIKEIRESRGKADAERRRTLERFKEHHAAVDRDRHAREAVLATKRGRFAALNVHPETGDPQQIGHAVGGDDEHRLLHVIGIDLDQDHFVE